MNSDSVPIVLPIYQLLTPNSPHIQRAVAELQDAIKTHEILHEILPSVEIMPNHIIDSCTLKAIRLILIDAGFIENTALVMQNSGYLFYHTPFFDYVRAMILAGVE